jgi:hypothetical protein
LTSELALLIALSVACVALILAHPRGKEAAVALVAGVSLYLFTRRKPAPSVPAITPKIPEGIKYEDVHKMDDAAAGVPADTATADELREWARDDVRDEK